MYNRKKKLQARKLDLPDALRLAHLLAKYIDTKDIGKDPQKQVEPVEFIAGLVSKMTPMDYLHCVKLLSGEDKVEAYPSITILTVFIEGLKLNRVVSLISFYRSLGF